MRIGSSVLKRLLYAIVGQLVALRDRRDRTAKWFPTCLGRNFLYEPLFPDTDGKAYFTKYHAEKPDNPLTVNFKRYKTDILRGVRVPANTRHRIEITAPSALPIAVTGVDITEPEGNFVASIKTAGRDFRLGGLIADRFYYLPIRESGTVEVESANDLIVADPIALRQSKTHPIKFVLILFVDNFGWDILGYVDFARDLPNLHKFFAKGLIFDRCYSSSNWTLTGVGSLVSGKSASNHGMFHNVRDDVFLGEGYKVLPEYFQADGYLTVQVCGNTRKSPAYRYVRGFDRTIYKNEMSLSDSVAILFDHLRAFRERDHFAWLTIFDAHHTLAGVPDVANQLALPLEAQDYSSPKEKSPLRLAANERQRNRYIEELRRVDFYLGPLFDHVLGQYRDDEMVVALVSDHGAGAMTDDPHELSHQKTHVPLMLRGAGVPQGRRTDEVVQNTDLLPAMLKLAGFSIANEIDGRLPSALGGNQPRDYALTEIKFPGKPYQAAIKSAEFEFYFRTEAPVRDDGLFPLDRYRTELFRRNDWTRDVSANHPELVREYVARVRAHLGR